MGEIAEAMINGLFCEQCGSYIDGNEPGYPRKCSDCKPKRKKPKKMCINKTRLSFIGWLKLLEMVQLASQR